MTRSKELEYEKQRAERLASFGSLASGVAHEIEKPFSSRSEPLPSYFRNASPTLTSVKTSPRSSSGRLTASTILSSA